jgi:hypothetical protein
MKTAHNIPVKADNFSNNQPVFKRVSESRPVLRANKRNKVTAMVPASALKGSQQKIVDLVYHSPYNGTQAHT